MKKTKRIICWMLISIAFLGLIYLPLDIIPQIVSFALSFFDIPETNYPLISSLLIAVILFGFSSDGMYTFLHKQYTKWWSKVKTDFGQGFVAMLISANDVWVAMPKRSLLFVAYLFYSIADKLGYKDFGVDVVFVGVCIIGVDRVAKSWKDERKKLFALGRKAYSEDNNFTDSIIEKASTDLRNKQE